MSGIRLAVPESATKDEIIEIKALIQHDMESGYRRDARGKVIPRDIIRRFECAYNGVAVFTAEFGPGIAANPYLNFYIKATESGSLDFIWTDQNGVSWSDNATITVTG